MFAKYFSGDVDEVEEYLNTHIGFWSDWCMSFRRALSLVGKCNFVLLLLQDASPPDHGLGFPGTHLQHQHPHHPGLPPASVTSITGMETSL